MYTHWSPYEFHDESLPDELRFEQQRMELLITRLGLTEHIEYLEDDFELMCELRRLSFESFHRLFPTFPWHLATKYRWSSDTHERHYVGGALWHGEFGRTPIWSWYKNLLDELATQLRTHALPEESRDFPLGLIFPALGVKGGLILHNAEAQTKQFHCFVAEDSNLKAASYCIEQYHDWLEAIALIKWTPTTRDPPLPRFRSPPFYIPGALIEPWMPKIVGTAATAIVFGFLVRVLYWYSPDDRLRPFLVRRRGELCLKANPAMLSRWTGVSVSQARSALTSLRKKGLILSEGNEIRLQSDEIDDQMRIHLPALFEPLRYEDTSWVDLSGRVVGTDE